MALSDEEFDSLGFTLVWRIENFSYCLEQSNCCIQSPVFDPNLYDVDQDWNMQIYPRGVGNFNAISYKLIRNIRSCMYFYSELAILTSDGSLTNFKGNQHNWQYASNTGEIALIDQEELFGEKKNWYLPQDILTLHLRMWCDLPSWRGQSFARTRIGVQKRTIPWKILQFSDKKPSTDKIFEIKQNFKENISLSLYLKNSFKCNEIFQLEISEADIIQDHLINVEIAVLDSSGSLAHLSTCDHWFKKREVEKIWTFPIPILKSTLLANKSLYLPKDTLTLQCSFALSVGVVYSELEFVEVGSGKAPYVNSFIPEIHQLRHKTENIQPKIPKSLTTDLLNLYTKGDNSDFELRAGSSNFPVHKVILMARSPVFHSMLSSDMIEKNTNMVDIPDLDRDTVKLMLHYMYTDAIEVAEWDTIRKLYFAADKYGIESLKIKCSSLLEKNICTSNVYEALELGELHQGQDLKVAAMTFVLRNDHKILISEEWMQFRKRNSSLAAEVLQWMYLKKIDEK